MATSLPSVWWRCMWPSCASLTACTRTSCQTSTGCWAHVREALPASEWGDVRGGCGWMGVSILNVYALLCPALWHEWGWECLPLLQGSLLPFADGPRCDVCVVAGGVLVRPWIIVNVHSWHLNSAASVRHSPPWRAADRTQEAAAASHPPSAHISHSHAAAAIATACCRRRRRCCCCCCILCCAAQGSRW